jgi:hypothetical protein
LKRLPQNFEGSLFIFSLYTTIQRTTNKKASPPYNVTMLPVRWFKSIALLNGSKLKDISLSMHHQSEFATIIENFAGGKTTNKNDQRSS